MLVNYNGVETLYYGYTDNQGSLIALTNESGSVVEKYAYDPWGARRDPANWQSKDTRTSFITNRGYTGHEHLDAFGIINMNGRVYDPLTTLFFSPDPFVQAPGNWLNFNRYEYCMNNPTKYTDPSGYKLADKNSVWYAEGYLNWMGYSGGGGGGGGGSSYFETSTAWNAQGSISYNYENQSYEYASGNKATEQEAMDMYARPSNSYTYYGRDASTVFTNLRDGDEYTNRALNNIGISVNANVANIEKGAVDAWDGMVNLLGLTNPISDIWNSFEARLVIADTYQIGLSADVSAVLGCGTTPINFTLLTRGEPGIYFTPTVNASISDGVGANAVVTFSAGWYTSDPREIKSSFLPGRSIGGSAAAGVILDVALSGSYSFAGNGNGFINLGGQFGFGIEGSPATAIKYQVNYQYTATAKPIIKL